MSEMIMVAGAGKSGLSATKMLLELGGSVLLYDSNEKIDTQAIAEKFDNDKHLLIKKGRLLAADLAAVNLCVISPGISLEAPFVSTLTTEKIPIWSEIQLAFQKEKGVLAAITGTNGKTTTTALAGKIVGKKYEETFTVGNIGKPYTETVLESTSKSATVLEVSSFQLETITDFHPHVSAILNITPDHLDRHHTMENYIEIKEDIAINQTKDDYCVLNYDDEVLRQFGQERCKATPIWFSSTYELEEGFFLKDGYIIYRNKGRNNKIVATDELQILGKHNHENAMAAIAIGVCLGVPFAKIREACMEFTAVEHRIEYVTDKAGVHYYNDSKGTNPEASMKAIAAMPGKVLLIAGGYDKGSEYDEWIKSFDGKVKYLVLIGQTRDKIAECAKLHGYTNIMYAESLEEAVKVCAVYADLGDCVLLSPACASWDMFKNYEQRGNLFKQYINSL